MKICLKRWHNSRSSIRAREKTSLPLSIQEKEYCTIFWGNVWTLLPVLERTMIWESIQGIDNSDDCGLNTLIFGLCFKKWSKWSHFFHCFASQQITLYICLGPGCIVANLVQALGHATFNSRSILKGNGHTQVTYLMTSNDADVVQAYPSYVKEIIWRCNNGEYLRNHHGWQW